MGEEEQEEEEEEAEVEFWQQEQHCPEDSGLRALRTRPAGTSQLEFGRATWVVYGFPLLGPREEVLRATFLQSEILGSLQSAAHGTMIFTTTSKRMQPEPCRIV